MAFLACKCNQLKFFPFALNKMFVKHSSLESLTLIDVLVVSNAKSLVSWRVPQLDEHMFWQDCLGKKVRTRGRVHHLPKGSPIDGQTGYYMKWWLWLTQSQHIWKNWILLMPATWWIARQKYRVTPQRDWFRNVYVFSSRRSGLSSLWNGMYLQGSNAPFPFDF